MKDTPRSYAESMERLDEILEDIDQNRISVDVLAERVIEAAALLKRCKGLLTATEGKVKEVLADLDREFGEAESEEEEDEEDLDDDDEEDEDEDAEEEGGEEDDEDAEAGGGKGPAPSGPGGRRTRPKG